MPRFTATRGWQWLTGRITASGGIVAVTSVFGRIGVVLAQLGDYTSSLITDVSAIGTATITTALNTLNSNPYPGFFWGATTTGNSTAARFMPLSVTVPVTATEAGAAWVVPCPGVVKYLAANFTTPLATANTTITVRKNGSSQAVTCTILATVAAGSDTTHSFAVTTGDLITIQTQTSAADNTTSNLRVSIGFARAA